MMAQVVLAQLLGVVMQACLDHMPDGYNPEGEDVEPSCFC